MADGENIWVANGGDVIEVQASTGKVLVQASTANVVATITEDASNQLNQPNAASFDGERILVTNYGGNSVTVFKAADLSVIANVSTGSGTLPFGAAATGQLLVAPL